MNPILEVNDQPKISNKAGKPGWQPNNFSSLDVQKEQIQPYNQTHYNKGLQRVTWGPSGESKEDQQIRQQKLPSRKGGITSVRPIRCGQNWSQYYHKMQQQLGLKQGEDPFAEIKRRRENNIPLPKMSKRDY